MSTERKGENIPEGSEGLKKDLKDFLGDATFGSAKYQGFMDCLNESELNDRKVDLIKGLRGESVSADRKYLKSELRIVEKRIALIEHEIEQKCQKLSGYFESYYTVWGIFDELGSVLHKEAREIYPGNEEEVDIYVTREWATIWDEARENLQERNQNQKPHFNNN